ncbi:MAG: SPOR domain-containing protein [Bacteroidota bacterium]
MQYRLFSFFLLSLACISGVSAQEYDLATVYAVQLGAFKNPKIADFEALSAAGYLYTEPAGKGLSRVLMGRYSDKAAGDKAKQAAQKAGFPNAFLKSINIELNDKQQVVSIETYDYQEPIPWSRLALLGDLYIISLDKALQVVVPTSNPTNVLSRAKKAGFSEADQISYPKALMHQVSTFEKNETPGFDANSQPLGQIQGARKSVRQLQEILKKNFVYTGTIDGIYGQETKLAFDDFSRGNRRFANYETIVQAKYRTDNPAAASLNDILAQLEAKPKAGAEALVKSDNSMAK